MGRVTKKGKKGVVTLYMTRNQALKKLQINLSDFRRLCILKGIYPREPKKRRKLNASGEIKTYYHIKDIRFLAHEPLLQSFRNFKVYIKKIKRAIGRRDFDTASRLKEAKPSYTLEHVIKERYPHVLDAIRDLDDALCLLALFSQMPQQREVRGGIIHICKRLLAEFQLYAIQKRALRKAFISVKGIYYQAEIMGERVTWITPHQFTTTKPNEVDFRLMLTFAEFYITLLGFINFYLYESINLAYPPRISGLPAPPEHVTLHAYDKYHPSPDEMTTLDILQSLNCKLEDTDNEFITSDETQTISDNEEELLLEGDDLTQDEKILKQQQKKEKQLIMAQKSLFVECVFFLSREVPKEPLVLIIRSCGGKATWDENQFDHMTESSEDITHQVVDRGCNPRHRYLTRAYTQPQWVFDSFNACKLLTVAQYSPTAELPPHLSPFVQEKHGDYIPPERKLQILDYNKTNNGDDGSYNGDSDQDDTIENIYNLESELKLSDKNVLTNNSEKNYKKLQKRKKREVATGQVIEGQHYTALTANNGTEMNIDASIKEKQEDAKLRSMLLSKRKRKLYEFIKKKENQKIRNVAKLNLRRQQFERARKLLLLDKN